MYEFQAGAHFYRSDRIPVLKQNQLVRRLAPFLSAAAGVYDLMKKGGDQIEAVMGPLGKAFAEMSDADVEYIQNACLAVVSRRDDTAPGKWARMSAGGGALMFDDIDLMELNTIVVNVLKDNLAGFFFGLVQSVSSDIAPTTVAASS